VIVGIFRDGHPRIVLIVIGRNCSLSIEFIVDTGFEGELALPALMVDRLGLAFKDFGDWELADGSIAPCRMLDAIVEMPDGARTVEVLALGQKCLVGTEFFKGFVVQIEMDKDGEVTAEEM
jgi:clan AA aspartic protease